MDRRNRVGVQRRNVRVGRRYVGANRRYIRVGRRDIGAKRRCIGASRRCVGVGMDVTTGIQAYLQITSFQLDQDKGTWLLWELVWVVLIIGHSRMFRINVVLYFRSFHFALHPTDAHVLLRLIHG